MTTQMPTICQSCKWYQKGGTCPAYPKGIPADIRTWGGDHRSVLPDQVGTTVWILADGKESEFEDWIFTFVLPPEE